MDCVWLFALIVTHVCAYFLGKEDAARQMPDEEAWIEVRKYDTDKRFEHLRWLEERRAARHDE